MKYLKTIYENRVDKNFDAYSKFRGNHNSTQSYGGQFHFDPIDIDRPILMMEGSLGQQGVIYFDNNKGSNFRPIRDSFLIYFLFLRYFFVAFCISIVDIVAIYVATAIFPVTYSFLIIRLVTAHVYFYLMKTKVFKSEGKIYFQLSLFYFFSLINILISWVTFDQIFFFNQF